MNTVTARDIFSGMKENFIKDAAIGMQAKVTYVLHGDDGGAWTLAVKDGILSVDEGVQDGVNATVTMDADEFVKIALGQGNPVAAFMTGKIKIQGDPFLVQKFLGMFKKPENM
ncbi:hypothetical protein BM613_01290 [Sulfoacidibacillus thermotolerans]|uniref:SCP2 domain-containing protein n=1 Tax=Sulfoacidibacillus thermotolerans TaxID=1765684 RepID=A0A2U3DBU7_SULT2|nr:hypothetical protein BM613_01290 [Sulfoacidibacillus thermotolerans]